MPVGLLKKWTGTPPSPRFWRVTAARFEARRLFRQLHSRVFCKSRPHPVGVGHPPGGPEFTGKLAEDDFSASMAD